MVYIVKITNGPWEGYYLGAETRVVNRAYAADKFPSRDYARNQGMMRTRDTETFTVLAYRG